MPYAKEVRIPVVFVSDPGERESEWKKEKERKRERARYTGWIKIEIEKIFVNKKGVNFELRAKSQFLLNNLGYF